MPVDMLDILRKYVFTEASLFLLICSSNGRITDSNPYTKQLLGFDPLNYKINDLFLDFTHVVEPRKIFKEIPEDKLFNIKTFTGLPQSLYFRFFDLGSLFLIVGRSDPREQENMRKEIIELNNNLNSLTRQLHKQNSELAKLNKLKDQFLSMAAHDLRNPSGVILNIAEILKENLSAQLTEEDAYLWDRMQKNALFMSQIINDFLDVSLIQAGQLSLRYSSCSIADLLRDNVRQHQIMAETSGLKLSLELPPENIIISCDISKIEQVLNNLLGNAIEHTEKGGDILVKLTADAEHLTITVRDTGMGISPDKIKEIFDFYSKDRKKLSVKKSSGLGLAISQKIIAAHQGKIWVESVVDKGSTFSFSIPLNK
ncbi:MAG: HAMP domain-containing histidine kinase [Candidatus Cloacimonetes bacterium]|nr:HAMP domain-containing histidine kinase [Candidatus Cloacimonadota bacterium]